MKTILGTMTWGPGAQTCKQAAVSQLKCAFQNLRHGEKLSLDTARMYQIGESEGMVGDILSDGTSLDPELCQRIEVHTKATPMLSRFTKDGLASQLDASLDALKKPSIHLFYLHFPDITTPIEETLEAVNDAHKQGKFTYFGLSNFAAWDVMRVHSICKEKGYVLPTVYQGGYNLLTRTIEPELLPALRTLGMSFYAYNPLAGGLLTGRYQSQQDLNQASSGRFSDEFDFISRTTQDENLKELRGSAGAMYRKRYGHELNFQALDILQAAIGSDDISLVQVAFRWLKHHSFLRAAKHDGIIVGASKVEQCESNLAALHQPLLPAHLAAACEESGQLTASIAEPYFRGYGDQSGRSEDYLETFE